MPQFEKRIVSTPSLFEVDSEFKDERFMRVRITAMHTGTNRNRSRFSLETLENAKDTFKNIPILAYVAEYTDADGNKYLDYAGHEMHIEEDAFNEGESKMIYDEKVVGIVPETNNFAIELDEETGNYYCFVDALLYRDYGNYACDILEARDNKTDVSMEIACEDLSFDANEQVMDVGIMTACAITLLGEHVTPGMAKAHADVFELDNETRSAQLMNIMQELIEALDKYTKENPAEGGTTLTKFEELLAKYGKTVEDIDFEYDHMSDDELETKFAELFESDPEPEQTFNKEEVFQQLFEISFEDIRYALNALCSAYRNDDEWCYVQNVYDDYFIMIDWDSDKIYKQAYERDGDSIALSGDRIELFAMYLTEAEKSVIDGLRASYEEVQKNYDALNTQFTEVSDKLSKYESEPSKMEILNSNDYIQIADLEEFQALKEVDAHFDMTVDELKTKCDSILLDFAKTGALKVAETSATRKSFAINTNQKKSSRYGNLFLK